VADALADIASKLSAESVEKDENLVALDDQIQIELGKIFPGVSAKTHIPTPEFGDFLKGATIKIFEENYHNPDGRDAASFGHGAQRSVQIALVKCLSQIKRAGAAGADRTTLLLIDEPELYLHPQAIELIRSSLSSLSSEGYQVVFSTHSPSMIARQDAQNALLIRRNVDDGTTAYPRIRDAVVEAVAGAAHQAETLFTLTNASKVLFSEKVVLAEGKTEQAIMPDIFLQEAGSTMDEEKLGLVTLGGSGNIPNAMRVLAAMGIPTKAVVDLDFAFKVAPFTGLIDEDHVAIVACKAILSRLSASGSLTLDASGLPKSENGITASMAFEVMCNEPDSTMHISAIQEALVAQGIWCWSRGTIETHLGLASKSAAEHMNFLSRIGDEEYRAGLPDYASAQAMMQWLRED
jgi:putative ATP-dependent endonuclease of OLD family